MRLLLVVGQCARGSLALIHHAGEMREPFVQRRVDRDSLPAFFLRRLGVFPGTDCQQNFVCPLASLSQRHLIERGDGWLAMPAAGPIG